MTARPIDCLFYSHAWVLHMLARCGLGDFREQVLIELSSSSVLAAVFGETGETRAGVAGLLQLSGHLDRLAKPYRNVPAPLILAPSPAVPVPALCSAVGLLAGAPGFGKRATLLVHIDEAPLFTGVYGLVERFGILWDIADLPGENLVVLAEVLRKYQCLESARWLGLRCYRHPRRTGTDDNERLAQFKSLINEFPGVAVGY